MAMRRRGQWSRSAAEGTRNPSSRNSADPQILPTEDEVDKQVVEAAKQNPGGQRDERPHDPMVHESDSGRGARNSQLFENRPGRNGRAPSSDCPPSHT